MKKKALITGITGQDGSYLAEYLLTKGYEVFGLVRRVAFEDETHRMKRILHLKDKLNLCPGSLESFPSIYKVISNVKPDEVYHLAAQSYVAYSFEDEFSTMNTNINGTHYVLSAVKDLIPNSKFYFAASSEMFGHVKESPQTENTPFNPRSAYGISKISGFYLTKNYREAYNLFACSGILYNHESPRRGFEFVTRKITSHVAMIKLGIKDKLELGNIDAKRDWGHSKEYVKAMWKMLQQETPDDYLIATGKNHSVKEFCEKAFSYVGLDWKKYVVINPKFNRPAEVETLCGDASKAKEKLGWKYTASLDSLIKEMVDCDLKLFRNKHS
ncbi:GDP-mannose 4,6-dehydratase [bacterium]|nr:GDP-mannose 4,6-dehydratase [bacterium]